MKLLETFSSVTYSNMETYLIYSIISINCIKLLKPSQNPTHFVIPSIHAHYVRDLLSKTNLCHAVLFSRLSEIGFRNYAKHMLCLSMYELRLFQYGDATWHDYKILIL